MNGRNNNPSTRLNNMSTPLQSVPALDSTLGAIQIGIVISLCLYGAMCVQAFTYYQAGFKQESLYVRVLVVWCLVVETVHTIFITVYLYQSTIRHFGDYTYFPVAQWSMSYSVATNSFVSTPVQIFFAFRIYMISKSWYFPAVLTFGSIMRTALSITTSVLATQSPTEMDYEHKYLYLAAWALAIGGTVDVASTIGLCYYLLRNKSEISRSRKMINKLVAWTIETGLVTSVFSALTLVFLLSMQDNSIWFCPLMFLAKLYSNSFYATLNARLSLRAADARVEAISMGSFQAPPHSRSGHAKIEVTQDTLISRSPEASGLSRIVKIDTTRGGYDGTGSAAFNGQFSQKDVKAESLADHV